MKNLTLSVDAEILEKVRLVAAQRRTSVNAMIRDYFESLIASERVGDEARAALLKLARERAGDMGTQHWKRADLYDR